MPGSNDVPVVIELSGRIDSGNASEVERSIMEQLAAAGDVPVELSASSLDYISSAGLRILLRVRKKNPRMRITGVNADIYGILEMTGFTQMMEVEKAYRVVSIEGCEEIGHGAKGTIYRLSPDIVVKVYNDKDALEDIRNERERARLALILGIPTAISYDVVRVGDGYGSLFELLNARSFSEILAKEPEKMDWCVKEFVGILKKLHATVAPPGKLPDLKKRVLTWVAFIQDYLPEEAGVKLQSLVEAVPSDNHLVHGDFHTKNLELQDDEVLLIDMDTLAVGHPIFELGSIFNAFIGYSEYDHEQIKQFQGYDFETGCIFWHKVLAAYLGTDNEERILEVENKARIIGYTRIIRSSIRRNKLETEQGRAEIELWKKELTELLEKTDTLLFQPYELELEARIENLSVMQAFIEKHLDEWECPLRDQIQINVAAEEIFVNIAEYAYGQGKGKAYLRMDVSGDGSIITLIFADQGMPYNPLAKQDPDVTLPVEKRNIGGLGIFMTKQIMDEESYEYKDGQNILTLKKYIKGSHNA